MSAADKAKLDGSTHYVGEHYGGGIVYFVYEGGRRGLIAMEYDQEPIGVQWRNGYDRATGSNSDGINAGAMNTAMIVATQMTDNWYSSFAAKICAEIITMNEDSITYGDWYLPSKRETYKMWSTIGQPTTNIGNFSIIGWYWTSTEYSTSAAMAYDFSSGMENVKPKSNTYRVRCIRSF